MKYLLVVLLILIILIPSSYSDRKTPNAKPSPENEVVNLFTNEPTITNKQSEVVVEDKEARISILELYEDWNGILVCDHREYSPSSTIYFSGDFVDCEIQLNYADNLSTTSDDLKIIQEKYIESLDEWRGVQFVQLFTYAQQPSVLFFKIEPSKELPLTISFSKKYGQEPMLFQFEYVEPLTCTISRPFEADNQISATGVRQYLLTGESHTYNISFSEPVHKDIVESELDRMLKKLNKEIKWLSDRSLALTLHLKTEDALEVYEEYVLHFKGDITLRGQSDYYWWDTQYTRFQPTNRKQYYSLNLLNQSEEHLFNSLISYSSLDLSPNGQWILAEELSSDGSLLFPSYTLLDRKGNRLKELKMASPVWLADGKSLLCSYGESVIRYDILSGEEEVIWTVSKGFLASFKYYPDSGKVLIASLHHDENGDNWVDLYVFKSVNDVNPRTIENVYIDHSDSEEWDGLHHSLPVEIIGDGLLYYENVNTLDYQWEYYIMDWNSGKTHMLETREGESFFYLSKGKLIRTSYDKWSVYDVISNKDTDINLTISYPRRFIVNPVRDKALLSISDDRNYVLNLNSLSWQQIKGNFRVISIRDWNSEVVGVK
ncbi:MAG: hypothetical protein P0Y55_08305 [Candidatus Cohnella colombiensis]|uniref:Uncharacterized protein n=1 Tax=Candidatus Cohnella colombiensis TaxID=3121368 RepID=A0AA95F1N5_9BACL|nr:MAG: hypothetical protein P0Y55_08305 [Cohnella sp.]